MTWKDYNLRKAFAPVIGLALLFFIAGGFPLLLKGIVNFIEVIIASIPLFLKIASKSLEEYFTSAYFVSGIIMAILSAFGLWLGVKFGKILFLVVSIVLEIISLASIGTNIL